MLISMAKKGWPRFLRSTVTRRDGWLWLVDGEPFHPFERGPIYTRAEILAVPVRPAGVDTVLEAIEWSPRVGNRWLCFPCGIMGPKDRPGLNFWACPDCGRAGDCRMPTRGRFIRVVDARREALGHITPEDLEAEGFPELSREHFVARYCGKVVHRLTQSDFERTVTRIEFEHLEGAP